MEAELDFESSSVELHIHVGSVAWIPLEYQYPELAEKMGHASEGQNRLEEGWRGFIGRIKYQVTLDSCV